MAQQPADDEEKKKAPDNRWKIPTAVLVIVTFLALTTYQTIRTGDIPITIALPLLAAASFALWTFKPSDWGK